MLSQSKHGLLKIIVHLARPNTGGRAKILQWPTPYFKAHDLQEVTAE